jgi:transcriptional regulator with XRE-family HTH domain
VAEEIRAQMGRKQKTGADLARALGKSQAWISYRLSGKQPIDLNDLEAIASILGVAVAELFPADVRQAVRTIQGNSAVADRPTDNRPPARPNSRGDRPVSTAPGSRRTRRIGSFHAMATTDTAA